MRRRVAVGAVLLALAAGAPWLLSRQPRSVETQGLISAGSVLSAFSEGGLPITVLIESVEPDPTDRDGDVFLYSVLVRGSPDTSWTPYCQPDRKGLSRAIPLRGAWDAKGDFHDGDHLLTFGCTNGAIGKCVRWGYKPWKSIAGRSLRDYHLACVRLVRADYCGNGVGHTRDGTSIDVFDPLHIQNPETPDPGRPEVLEAGWSPQGATWLNVPRWSDDVAEVIRECPEHFAGRTSRDRRLSVPQVLESFPETLIFNNRMVNDADRMAP